MSTEAEPYGLTIIVDTAIPQAGRLTTADANKFVSLDIEALLADADGVQRVLDALVAKPYPQA